MTEKRKERLLLGQITGAFGNKGELKLYSGWTVELAGLAGKRLYLEGKNGDEITVVLEEGRRHKNANIIRIEGCGTMSDAERYCGYSVFIDECDLPRGDDEIYYSDIEGFTCFNASGRYVGTVCGFSESPHYDILNIKKEDGTVVNIPVLDELIEGFDIEEKRVLLSSRADAML